MAVLDELVVKLNADTASLERGLNQASSSIKKTSSSGSRSLEKLGKAFKGVTGSVFNMRNGVIALAGATALGFLIRRNLNLAESLQLTSDKVGLTTKSLQELRFAAELVNVPQTTLDMAMQRFSRRLGEAVNGLGELKGVLEQYNISVKNADGSTRSMDAVLNDLADTIQKAGSEQERLRISFKAFDSEGAALVNVLRNGSSGLDAFRAEANKLGVVLDEATVKKAAKANTVLTKLGIVFRNNLTNAVAENSEAIEKLGNEAMTSLAAVISDPKFIQGLGTLANIMLKIAEGAALAGRAIQKVVDSSRNVGDVIGKFIGERFTKPSVEFSGSASQEEIDDFRRSQENGVEIPEQVSVPEVSEDPRIEREQKAQEKITEIQNDALAKRNSDLQEFLKASFDINSQFDKQTTQEKAKTMRQQLAQAAESNRAFFAINKAAALAEASISAAKTVVDAYSFGTALGGPLLGAAFAATAATAQAANISRIASSRFGGGNASVSAPASAVPQTPTQTQDAQPVGVAPQGRNVNINLTNIGDDTLLSGRQVRGIIEQISEEINNGSRIDIQGGSIAF